MDKNKRSLVIITVLTIIFALSGATLAYWGWATNEAERTNVVFTIGKNFSCAADGGGDITSSNVSLAPTTCTDPNYAIKREVVVTPTMDKDNMTIHMNLYLNVNSIGTGLSQSQNFKYALTTSSTSCTEGVIHTGNFHGLKTGDSVKILDSEHSNETPQTYYLYVWLDKVETSSATQKQNFSLSLAGNCSDVSNTDLQYNVTTVNNKNTFGVGSGFYTLSSYTCENGTTLSYDTNSKTITSNGIDKCNLNFTSVEKKLYDIVEIGDYIEYFGNNGCTGNQCNGWNANQTDTDIYENYGYCNSSSRFNNYGWRVLHKTDNSVYIVSAGAPECLYNSGSTTERLYKLSEIALKYCNPQYTENGICSYATAHPFNEEDFHKFTSQYYGKENARYLYNNNGNGSNGVPNCVNNATTYCGMNNDIIFSTIGEDKLSGYFFDSLYNGTYLIIAIDNVIKSDSGMPFSFGVRPVIKLDASLLSTGGNGTIDNPYTISERTGA